MLENPGDAVDNRKPQPQPGCRSGALLEPRELPEHGPELGRGNADASIDHLNDHLVATPPDAHQHPALAGVFDGVGNQILDQPAQQVWVGADINAGWHDRETQVFLARYRGKIGDYPQQQVVERKACQLRLHGPGVQPRNIEHRAKNGLHRFQ